MNHQLDYFVSVSACVFLGRVKMSVVAISPMFGGNNVTIHE